MGSFTIAGKAYTPQEIVAQAIKAPGILGAIAVFSVINSVLIAFGVELSFVIGLGLTTLADSLLLIAREEVEGGILIALTLICLAFNAAVIGCFLLLWWLSRRGSRAAYIVACVIYSADTLIFLAVQDWVGVGFHAFFLFLLFTGYTFVKRRPEAEAMLLAASDGTPTSGISSAEPPPLIVPPVPASIADTEAVDLSSHLESIWASFPSYRDRIQAQTGDDSYALFAREGYGQFEGVGVWSAAHDESLNVYLGNWESLGYGEEAKQFGALAVGIFLGMHAAGDIDDDGYLEGGEALQDFLSQIDGAMEET